MQQIYEEISGCFTWYRSQTATAFPRDGKKRIILGKKVDQSVKEFPRKPSMTDKPEILSNDLLFYLYLSSMNIEMFIQFTYPSEHNVYYRATLAQHSYIHTNHPVSIRFGRENKKKTN